MERHVSHAGNDYHRLKMTSRTYIVIGALLSVAGFMALIIGLLGSLETFGIQADSFAPDADQFILVVGILLLIIGIVVLAYGSRMHTHAKELRHEAEVFGYGNAVEPRKDVPPRSPSYQSNYARKQRR